MALVVEAAVSCDPADRVGRFPQPPLGHQEPQAKQVVTHAHAEEPAKLTLQLARRQFRPPGQVCDADRPTLVREHIFHRRRETPVFIGRVAGVIERPQHAGQP